MSVRESVLKAAFNKGACKSPADQLALMIHATAGESEGTIVDRLEKLSKKSKGLETGSTKSKGSTKKKGSKKSNKRIEHSSWGRETQSFTEADGAQRRKEIKVEREESRDQLKGQSFTEHDGAQRRREIRDIREDDEESCNQFKEESCEQLKGQIMQWGSYSDAPTTTSNGLPGPVSKIKEAVQKADGFSITDVYKRNKPLHPVTLSYDQILEYERAFKVYDMNGDGVISVDELSHLLETVGLRPSEEEVMAMIGSVDMDNDGVLSICEFIKLMSRQHNPFITPRSQFEAIFETFDADGNGFISRDEFKDTLFSIGQRCSEQELLLLLNEIDRNKDGRISKKEFLHIFNCDDKT